MRIIIDTREQKPLRFDNEYITQVETKTMAVGDYGCVFKDGHEVPIYFERKSISDLFGTMGAGYPRFKREILRAQEKKATLFIIVEGALYDIFRGCPHSQLKGISVIRKLFTLWVRYGVQPIFVEDRDEMSEYITQFYIACGKDYVRRIKQRT